MSRGDRIAGRTVVVIIVVIVSLLLAALGGFEIYRALFEPRDLSRSEPAAVAVEVQKISARVLEGSYESTGFLKPLESIRVAAETSGRIVTKLKQEGDPITAGEVIVALDDATYQSTVRTIQARGRALQAQLVFSRKELEKTRALVQKNSLGESELDRMVAEVERLEANIEENRALLEEAERNVARCRITAPCNGILYTDLAEAGEYVLLGTAVAEIRVVDPLELEVEVPATVRLILAVGRTVPVRLLDLEAALHADDIEVVGTIQRLAAGSRPDSRRFPVVLRIPNPEGRLVPGLFCAARFNYASSKAVLLAPKTAVRKQYGQHWMFSAVEEDGRLRARQQVITVAPVTDRPAQWNVIEGLQSGQMIIVAPLEQLRDGIEVTLEKPRPTASAEDGHAAGGNRSNEDDESN